MTKFEESELEGRRLLKSFLDQINAEDQQPTKDLYDRVDYYATLVRKDKVKIKAVFEIKVRNQLYDTMAIEESKYQAILADMVDKGLDAGYYVNFIGNRCYLWSTQVIAQYQLDNMHAPMSTYGYRKYVDKTVRYLPIDKALVIEWNNNKWQKV